MKIVVDIDCTPAEARAFLGLPDVQPMQEALMREVQARLSAVLAATDPDAMLRTWMPATLKGFEQLQEMFLAQMAPGKRGRK
jgi:predicted component of type VI protein secretion system